MAMTLLGRRLRAGCYEEVALSLALGLARALAKLPPGGVEGLLEVLEGAGRVPGSGFLVPGSGFWVAGARGGSREGER